MSKHLDCLKLSTRHGFDAYITLLLQETNDDLALLGQCKSEVCTALWGQGNSDISGIGMMVAYFLEQILGLALAAAFLYTSKRRKVSRLSRVSGRALQSFGDCATFFAFSIEIAAIVVLVREEFGISTSGMGDATVRITQAVSVLVLLPLIYVVVIPMLETDHVDSEASATEKPGLAEHADTEQEEAPQRFILLVLCWLLAFYPFFSKMNDLFGPSQISSSGIITKPDFAIIEGICMAGIRKISGTEDDLMTAFEISSYVPLSVLVLSRILWLGLEKHYTDSKVYNRLLAWRRTHMGEKKMGQLRMSVLVVIPLLACGLLWTVLRTQRFQQQMAAANNSGDSDDQWTFGQVVAVTLFAPIIVQCWSASQEDESHDQEKGNSVDA